MDVFSVAAGAMISSGLFVLPAIAYGKAGPGVIVSYILASILILPGLLSQVELATAMPKAGGTYFYVERSLGGLWGVFSGLANWFSMALKSAFAVVGIAVFVQYVFGRFMDAEIGSIALKEISVICCILFAALNIVSVKHTGRLQGLLVIILLCILSLFIVFGTGKINVDLYKGFADKGWLNVLSTAGLVFISFGGLTKVASIAEEVKDPGRNMVWGMMLAWGVVSFFYIAVVSITVGVLNGNEMVDSLMPVSLAAGHVMGSAGFVLVSIAALTAYITTANGGILAASRSPMAMSRDGLLPIGLARISKRFETPHMSIILTAAFMIAALIFLNIETLVKTASTLLLILYIFGQISVIVMRESRIASYRPKFRMPFYPYMPIAAIILYIALIVDMGMIPLLISAGFVVLSAGWYLFYASRKVGRASAVMHIVERVTARELGTVTLETELRDILIERDNIIEDRFDKLIRCCPVLQIEGKANAEDVFRQISALLGQRLDISEYVLMEKFLAREKQGGTIVQSGFAIPHIVVDGENKFEVVLVRAKDGIIFPHAPDPVRIMFILAGSRDQRNYHLRALMAIAQISQEKDFEKRWTQARDTEGLRNMVLLSKRKRDAQTK
ncbi:MAG: amino acid permease [Phycisphaerae bacterium]|nr:amino acid permease [Phycisphaerae bacterium]